MGTMEVSSSRVKYGIMGKICFHSKLVESCAVCREGILLSPPDREAASRFANLRTPTWDSNGWEEPRTRYHGKLGEIAFAKLLVKHGKLVPSSDEFTEWVNFEADNSESNQIDVTTRGVRYGVIRVPGLKVNNSRIGFYVAVRIAEDDKTAFIEGFASRVEMKDSGTNGEDSNIYERRLAKLHPIGSLLCISRSFRLVKKWWEE